MAVLQSFLSPLETAGFFASWVERIPGVDTAVDRAEAVARLTPHHHQVVSEMGGEVNKLWLSEQVHGNVVAHVSGQSNGRTVMGADGLSTNDPSVTLGIYVADCGAVYIVDPVKRAISLLHSGRAGTDQNIVGAGIEGMQEMYESAPQDLVVVLAPCIRPPAYEVDFAATIREQALSSGVLAENYHDCGICTTSDLDRFYSYRQEEGRTGRMLALLRVGACGL